MWLCAGQLGSVGLCLPERSGTFGWNFPWSAGIYIKRNIRNDVLLTKINPRIILD